MTMSPFALVIEARGPRAMGALVLAAVLVASVGCTPARPALPTASAAFVVPTELANGRVEVTLLPSYRLGQPATLPVTIIATRGSMTGPANPRIVASAMSAGKSEVLVRRLDVPPVTVRAGERRTISVSWDGRDEHGVAVPADTYSLLLDFRNEGVGEPSVGTAGVTIELGP